MTTKAERDFIPMWCEGCNQQGEIAVVDSTMPVFVRCSNCGHEDAEVWCEKCGMGGQFIRHLERHPSTWTCSGCKTVYTLPSGFYDHPVPLQIMESYSQSRPANTTGVLDKLLFAGVALIMGAIMVAAVWKTFF